MRLAPSARQEFTTGQMTNLIALDTQKLVEVVSITRDDCDAEDVDDHGEDEVAGRRHMIAGDASHLRPLLCSLPDPARILFPLPDGQTHNKKTEQNFPDHLECALCTRSS